MESKSIVLTEKERALLILGSEHKDFKHLSNAELAKRLDVSVSCVKAILHHACIKLGARSRNEAIMNALKWGVIDLREICTPDDMARRFKSFGPYTLRMIAHVVREGLEYSYFLENYKRIIPAERKKNTILTQAERDVLILAGYGFTNKEIAERLYMSISSVRTFLYRACTKLGAQKRADVVMLALKYGEINACDVFSPDEILRMFAPLGTELIEEVAQLMDQESKQELSLAHF